jgi:hypothetical protein
MLAVVTEPNQYLATVGIPRKPLFLAISKASTKSRSAQIPADMIQAELNQVEPTPIQPVSDIDIKQLSEVQLKRLRDQCAYELRQDYTQRHQELQEQYEARPRNKAVDQLDSLLQSMPHGLSALEQAEYRLQTAELYVQLAVGVQS